MLRPWKKLFSSVELCASPKETKQLPAFWKMPTHPKQREIHTTAMAQNIIARNDVKAKGSVGQLNVERIKDAQKCSSLEYYSFENWWKSIGNRTTLKRMEYAQRDSGNPDDSAQSEDDYVTV